MNTYQKSRPLPADPAAEAAETERRESLNNDDAYKRGLALAQATERANAQGALTSALSDLKRCSLVRDTTLPARDAYNRCHARVIRAAERVVENTGANVVVPAWLPPPTVADAPTITVGAKHQDGTYRETRGMGKSGEGLPLQGPGSNVDPNWMETT